jgi:hypothetical protein
MVKEVLVSPRPWKSRRMFTGEPLEGGTMSREMFWGKSSLVGRRGGAIEGGSRCRSAVK